MYSMDEFLLCAIFSIIIRVTARAICSSDNEHTHSVNIKLFRLKCLFCILSRTNGSQSYDTVFAITVTESSPLSSAYKRRKLMSSTASLPSARLLAFNLAA